MNCDFETLAVSGVQQLKPYEPGKPIEELERELSISGSIKLASNENPIGPSPRAVAAINACVPQVSFYPDGNGFELKKAIATRHGIGEDRVTLGNGSNDILELIARTFLSAEAEAVFSEHAFAVYPIVTQATGATARIATAYPSDHVMPYGHDPDSFMSMVNANTRVVFIANPNNPTGTWLDRSTLKRLLGALPETALIVVDEAYFEYVVEENYPSAAEWLENYPNLVVTRTFSKIYGLAGVRIGYGLSSPEIADLLNRVRQPFNVNSLAQAGALAALGDSEHVRHSVELNTAGLKQLADAFTTRGLAFIPSVGNFICVDTGRPAHEVYQALLKEAVIVRPIANYGLPKYLRITVGAKNQNQRVIAALDKVLQ